MACFRFAHDGVAGRVWRTFVFSLSVPGPPHLPRKITFALPNLLKLTPQPKMQPLPLLSSSARRLVSSSPQGSLPPAEGSLQERSEQAATADVFESSFRRFLLFASSDDGGTVPPRSHCAFSCSHFDAF